MTHFKQDEMIMASTFTVNSQAPLSSKVGMSLFSAAVFIVGEMAGSGILALPAAVANAGWTGILLIIFACMICGHASIYLARCWNMVEEKWPEYQQNTRDPFPTIGGKAVGPWMHNLCSFLMDIQQFGVGVVFLLLCADLTKALLNPILPSALQLPICTWIIVIGLVLLPFSWLGSPQDFTPIAFAAMACTAVSCVLVLIIYIKEGADYIPSAKYEDPTFSSFSLAFGTILFAFGGACTFPTFQNDMREKHKFGKAVIYGFSAMMLLYLPIAIGGYALFGRGVEENVLDSVSPSVFRTMVNAFMAFHLFCAYLIVINPLNLDLEKRLKLKHSFNFKRTAFRSMIGLLIIFVGLSVPKFGKILNLVGGSTVSVLTYVLPPWFYVNLSKMASRKISFTEQWYLVFMVLIGVTGCVAITYFSMIDIVKPDSLDGPCYFCWR